jgi:hypothetical protein
MFSSNSPVLAGKPGTATIIPPRKQFTPEEDQMLKDLVARFGDRAWTTIANQMSGRRARQCRERYQAYLAPGISNGRWNEQEDQLLREKFAEMGPQWAKMTASFDGRSNTNLKNRWTALVSLDRLRLKAKSDAAAAAEARRTDWALIWEEVADEGNDSMEAAPVGPSPVEYPNPTGVVVSDWDISDSERDGQELDETVFKPAYELW